MTTVKTEKKERYAILSIDRPKALNALNESVLSDLYNAVQQLTEDKDMRAMIITGSGEKAFVAGADIAAMKSMSAEEAEAFAKQGHRTMNAIAQAELISVAAINGFALGGGLELALACDMRMAADTARMGLPEVTLGLIPGFGGTQRLPRVVGKGIAMEIILSGDMIDATRAESIGLVNAVHPGAELLAKTEEFIQRMVSHKSIVAQRAARWAVQAGLDMPLPGGLEKEIASFADLFNSKDPEKGMTAFLEKQKPDF